MVRTRVEVQEQTEVGDALVRGLVRAQLGLALRLATLVGLVVLAIPLLGSIFPTLETVTIFGVRANWMILGIGLYPMFYLAGRLFVRLAEQSERDFIRIVDEGSEEP